MRHVKVSFDDETRSVVINRGTHPDEVPALFFSHPRPSAVVQHDDLVLPFVVRDNETYQSLAKRLLSVVKKETRLKDVFKGATFNMTLEEFVRLPETEWQVVNGDGEPLKKLSGVERVTLMAAEEKLVEGQRISVMWKVGKKKRWFKAVVEGYSTKTRTHRVRYVADDAVVDEPLYDRDWKKLKR